jgi:drug/metabolite transporter (DMT)-like permease
MAAMNPSLLAVAGAAVCSGTAAVLQASAVARLPRATSVSGSFVLRLARSPRYLAALGLIAVGFALSFLALRTLPLFAVQAGRASSLAVTAVLSVLALGVRLRRAELIAVLAIGAGLVVVGWTAGEQASAQVGGAGRVVLLAAVLALLPVAAVVLRMRELARSGLLLAVIAGTCFGLLALGARILRGFDPGTLLTDPAAWAMAGAGTLGLLSGALALQRASVVTVTAAMVAVETVLGSVLGMLACGDRPTPGLAVPAALGFALVLVGALTLARFGAPEADADGHEEPATLPIG